MNRAVIFDERRMLPTSADHMREQVNAIQKLMEAVMKEGEHYGRIPGTRKPSLWKPGAEKLSVAFHVEPSFVVEDLSTAECYRYRVKCVGTHQITGTKLGEGMGACSSLEQRFKWRKADDAEFESSPDERRRFKHGYDREKRRPYEVKQVRAEHHDVENTILKMACKRAHVAMVLNVTAASDIFTQDIEDLPEHLRDEVEAAADKAKPIELPRSKSKKQPSRAEAPDPSATKAPQTTASVGLSQGQCRILRNRMQKAKVSEVDLIKSFGSGLESLPAAKFNEIATWVRSAKELRA